ncbi:MAG: S41 family peptidase [Bacteroidota bacterium]
MPLNSCKPILLVLCFLFSCNKFPSEKITDEEKLLALAEVCGYVKYFHPSDRAATLDWDAFTILASQRILESNDMKETLEALFGPIAPKIKINKLEPGASPVNKEESVGIDSLNHVFWQHVGDGQGSVGAIYQSARVNKKARVLPNSTNDYSGIAKEIPTANIKGKKIVLTALLRPNNDYNGRPSVRLHLKRKNKPWEEIHSSGQPLIVNTWNRHSVSAQVPNDIELVRAHLWNIGIAGSIDYDNIRLVFGEGKDNLVDYTFNDVAGFDKEWNPWGDNQSIRILNLGDNPFLRIERSKGDLKQIKPLFPLPKRIQRTINKKIGEHLSLTMPILFDKDRTKNHGNDQEFERLKSTIDSVAIANDDFNNVHLRIANIIKVWVTMKHFNPNLDTEHSNWKQQFLSAVAKTKNDKTRADHLNTLKMMVAPINDSHLGVYHAASKDYFPPFSWEMVEDELIITKVLDSTLDIAPSYLVERVNGRTVREFWDETLLRSQGAHADRKNAKAIEESLGGKENSSLTITVTEGNGTKTSHEIVRTLSDKSFEKALTEKRDFFYEISKDVFYVDLTRMKWSDLKARLNKISKTKAVIFDVRGYLSWGNIDIVSHLIKDAVQGVRAFVPHILYPDQKDLVLNEAYHYTYGPKAPYISAKKVFITDHRAVSYSEELLNLVEYHNLAIIVGEQTAGSTGNVNILRLLDGISIPWSGMKVLRQDGSEFHGRGILPDHLLSKSRDAIRNGEDEYLMYALKLVGEN